MLLKKALLEPGRYLAEPDAADGVVISIVYVKPIGSEHTADLEEGSKAILKTKKGGWGEGSISLARRATAQRLVIRFAYTPQLSNLR